MCLISLSGCGTCYLEFTVHSTLLTAYRGDIRPRRATDSTGDEDELGDGRALWATDGRAARRRVAVVVTGRSGGARRIAAEHDRDARAAAVARRSGAFPARSNECSRSCCAAGDQGHEPGRCRGSPELGPGRRTLHVAMGRGSLRCGRQLEEPVRAIPPVQLALLSESLLSAVAHAAIRDSGTCSAAASRDCRPASVSSRSSHISG